MRVPPRFLSGATISAIVIVLTGCQTSSTTATSTTAPSIFTSTEATASTSAACVDADAVTPPPPSSASALSITLAAVTAEDGAEDYVLPSAIRSDFPEFVAGHWPFDNGTDADELSNRVLKEGAFIYGHPYMDVVLGNTATSALTVTGVRVTNLRSVCLPNGLLVRMGAEGGDDVPIEFNLDAAQPIAMISAANGQVAYKPYFEQTTEKIAAGDQLELNMNFDVSKHARVFDLTVSYVLKGKSYTQTIRPPGGRLFRVMPLTCPASEDLQRMSPQEISTLAAYRFDKVLDDDVSGNNLVLKNRDPAEFSEDCTTR